MTEAEIQQAGQRQAPGARRKKARLRQTPVMMREDERAALDAVAFEMGRSRSALIREAVRRVWLKGKSPRHP